MALMTFRFLGSPGFHLDGIPIKIGRRKAVALAAYLTVSGIPHTRAHLANMFWPEYPQDKARASLRRTLSVMTKALGTQWLHIDREAIGARSHDGLWVDATEFLRLTDWFSGETAPLSEVEKIAAIYGNRFLAGFELGEAPEFDDWQFEQADRFNQRAALVVEHLVEGYRKQGEYPKAIAAALRWVRLDSFNEEAHRQLIELYVKAGHRGAALCSYEKCRELLQRELGVEPEKETLALAQTIRSNPETLRSWPLQPQMNIPAHSSFFVGRKSELSRLMDCLTAPENRLVTLTGPGGIGKTRLSLEIAASLTNHFPQGIFFVPLVSASSEEDICSELAGVLGLRFDERTASEEQLLEYLKPRNCLLILDNFDGLAHEAMLISRILEQAPEIKVLATSRSRLLLKEEQIVPLSGLAFPADPAERTEPCDFAARASQYDAMTLFAARARMLFPGFAIAGNNCLEIARICKLTGGMPLALILAAGWSEVYSLGQIADEIEEGLGCLEAAFLDMAPEHRSIHAVFDVSWAQLTEIEQDIFMKLSVFQDGFSLEALTVVTGYDRKSSADIVKNLVRKSMLTSHSDSGRFSMHPLLRQYGWEQLARAGRTERMMDSHKQYYLGLAYENGQELIGESMLLCRQRMDGDFPNIRMAWNRALVQEDLHSLLSAVQGLYVYFDMHTRYHDGAMFFGPAKELVSSVVSRGEAWPDLGIILVCWFDMQGQGFSAQPSVVSSPGLFEETHALGCRLLKIAVKSGDLRSKASVFLLLGAVAHRQSLYRRAVRFYSRSLALVPEGEHSFWVTIRIGLCWRALGEIPQAMSLFRQSRRIGQRLGDAVKQAWSLGNIGSAELCLGNLEKAEVRLAAAAESFRKMHAPVGILAAMEELALIAFLQGDFAKALSLADQTLRIAGELGWAESHFQRGKALKGLVLVATGEPHKAHSCLVSALKTGMSRFTVYLGLAFWACSINEVSEARVYGEKIERRMRFLHKAPLNALGLLALADIAVLSGEDKAACEFLGRFFQHPGFSSGVVNVWKLPEALLAGLRVRMPGHEFEQAWCRGEDSLQCDNVKG